jgi:hypothetical protein
MHHGGSKILVQKQKNLLQQLTKRSPSVPPRLKLQTDIVVEMGRRNPNPEFDLVATSIVLRRTMQANRFVLP